MTGLQKLFESSTFVLTVLAFGVHAVTGLPLMELLAAVGIYAAKEGAGKIGDGLASNKPAGPDKAA